MIYYGCSHVMEYDDALLVVSLDDVTTSRVLTSSMAALVKTTTIIQWEESPGAIVAFWGRIQIALQEVMQLGRNTRQQRQFQKQHMTAADFELEIEENV